MNTRKEQNSKSKISLWLNQDLVQIIKDNQVNLNEELRNFFENKNQDIGTNLDVTLDSYPEIQKMIKLLSKLDNEVNQLLGHIDSFTDPLIDIGTDVFYDDFDSDEDDSCNRLSAFFSAFHQRPKEREKIKKQNNFYRSLQNNFFMKKIEQIKSFYNLNDEELGKYDRRQLIEYLLSRVDNNKDIIDILDHKNIRNQSGNAYTRTSIAKKRHLLKKSYQRYL